MSDRCVLQYISVEGWSNTMSAGSLAGEFVVVDVHFRNLKNSGHPDKNHTVLS